MSVFTRRRGIRFHSNKDSQQSSLLKQTKTLRATRILPFCAVALFRYTRREFGAGIAQASEYRAVMGTQKPEENAG
jgi:hypothetical protein